MKRLKHCWAVAFALVCACGGPVAPPCLKGGLDPGQAEPIGFPGETLRVSVLATGRPQLCFATSLTAQVTVSDPSGVDLPVQLLGLQDNGSGFLQAVVEFRPRQTGPHFVQVSFEPNLNRSGRVVDVAARGSFAFHRAAQAPAADICVAAAVFSEGRALCSAGRRIFELREDAGATELAAGIDVSGRGADAWSFTPTEVTHWKNAPTGTRTTTAIPCFASPCDTEWELAYLLPSSGDEALLISNERVVRLSDMAELIKLPGLIRTGVGRVRGPTLNSSASWPEGSADALLMLENALVRLSVADGGVSTVPLEGEPAGSDAYGVWFVNAGLINHVGFSSDGGLELIRTTPPARDRLFDRPHRLRDSAPIFRKAPDDGVPGWVLRHDGQNVVLEALPPLQHTPLFARPRQVFAGRQGALEWLIRDGP